MFTRFYTFYLQGYAAGSAIPSPRKNVEKEFLKKYWAKWKATHTGRWYCPLICLQILTEPESLVHWFCFVILGTVYQLHSSNVCFPLWLLKLPVSPFDEFI